MNGTWIRLNIGGNVFQTTKQTLCRDPESFLARLCQENEELSSVKDDSGAILIDRDPQYFDMILHYLRTGFLKVVENAPVDELVEEAEFYNLPLLSELIMESMIATKLRKRAQEMIIVTRRHKDQKVEVVMTVTCPNYVVLKDLKKKGLAVKGYGGAYWLDANNASGREFDIDDLFDEEMQDVLKEPNGWDVVYARAWPTFHEHGFKIVNEEKNAACTKWEFVRDADA